MSDIRAILCSGCDEAALDVPGSYGADELEGIEDTCAHCKEPGRVSVTGDDESGYGAIFRPNALTPAEHDFDRGLSHNSPLGDDRTHGS